MALQCKKIKDEYIEIDLYYRISAIEFLDINCIVVRVEGYSLKDLKRETPLDQHAYTFIKNKDEVISYELAYNLLKTKEEFKDAIDC